MNNQLAMQLYDIGAVKFGEFKLKSGIMSPIYIDLRVLASHPATLKNIAHAMNNLITSKNIQCDITCGVPLTGIPLATAYALENNTPMVMCRKETKEHGTKKMIEGNFEKGQSCLLIEDLITSGMSSLETIEHLHAAELQVKDIIVVLDREQGGKQYLEEKGYRLHALFTLHEMLDALAQTEKITREKADEVARYCAATKAPKAVAQELTAALTYGQRSQLCSHPIAKKLLQIMETKQTNLCIAADVTKTSDLLDLIKKIGSEICMLKLHIDILEDFDASMPQNSKLVHKAIILCCLKIANLPTLAPLCKNSAVMVFIISHNGPMW